MSANDKKSAPGSIVQRDHQRFRSMAPEPRAVIPPGYTAELDLTPIRVAIRQRREASGS